MNFAKRFLHHFFTGLGISIFFFIIILLIIGLSFAKRSDLTGRRGGDPKPFHLSKIYQVPKKAQLVRLDLNEVITSEFTETTLIKLHAILNELKHDSRSELNVDQKLKGLLLVVNSPGGSAASSQELYFTIKKIAEQIPVITFCRDVAASGAYYALLPSTQVFATPASLLGSIGVKSEFLFAGELARKIGIEKKTLSTGPLKAPIDPLLPLDPESETFFEKLIMEIGDQFLSHVKQHRNLSEENFKTISDGRVVLGSQALPMGLADQLGSYSDALDYLREITETPDAPLYNLEMKADVNLIAILKELNKLNKSALKSLASFKSLSSFQSPIRFQF